MPSPSAWKAARSSKTCASASRGIRSRRSAERDCFFRKKGVRLMTRREMLAAAGSATAFVSALKPAAAQTTVMKNFGVASTSFGARLRAGHAPAQHAEFAAGVAQGEIAFAEKKELG